tara:strand:- start:3009 stop:6335 length:3327 start_codon:yes stop_codon:yes gene_type:complete
MRKEVKRSLVIWPTLASTAMIGMSCLSMISGSATVPAVNPDIAIAIAGSSWNRLQTSYESATNDFGTFESGARLVDALARNTPPTIEDEFADRADRSDHGSRAMKLPQRLELVLGTDPAISDPPVSNVKLDVPDDPGLFDVQVPEPRIDVLARGIDVRRHHGGVLQEFPSTKPFAAIVSSVVVPREVLLEPPSETVPPVQASSLPESISVLAKVRPESVETDESTRDESDDAILSVSPSTDDRAVVENNLATVQPDATAERVATTEIVATTESVQGPVDTVTREPELAASEADAAASEPDAVASDTGVAPEESGNDTASSIQSVIHSLQLSRPVRRVSEDESKKVLDVVIAEERTVQQQIDDVVRQLQASIDHANEQVDSVPHSDLVSSASNLASPATWPVTKSLNERLVALTSLGGGSSSNDKTWVTIEPRASRSADDVSEIASQWAREVSQTLENLQSLHRLGDERAGQWISRLETLGNVGIADAELVEDSAARVRWLQAAFAVARRAAVWRPVWEVAKGDTSIDTFSQGMTATQMPIGELTAAVKRELAETGDQSGWRTFLLLDELEEAASQYQMDARAEIARRFLSRLQHDSLHPSHQQWLERSSVTSLANAVRPWTNHAIDYANLLNEIERQETDSLEISTSDIATAVQTLRFAENEKLTNVAQAIDAHYRNANVRVAVTGDMLTRLLPSMKPRTLPIRTTVMGSRVRGNSRVESDLNLLLHPSPDHWSLSLRALGDVQTQSVGYSGPVAVQTQGRSHFVAATPIEVTLRGIQVGDPLVNVQGNTILRGVQSKYDQVPIMRGLVHSIAQSRYQSMAPRTNRIASRMMKSQIAETIDQTLEDRITKATERLSHAVVGPLGRMELNPQVIDMQTTSERLLARYRLAGESQLAAFTPRPRAPSASLMSVQVHQSAINNTLEQLVPTGTERSVQQAIIDALEVLGADNVTLPDDLPDDVTIQFSNTRPITVEIENGQLWVSMKIVRLNKADKLKLSRFIVRAAYKPVINGINISLVRDGHLRISGAGMSMRERLPVRAIFNKVLSPTREFPLTLPQLVQHQALDGLVITQLELRDGWIGVAVGTEDSPKLALAATEANQSDQASLER